MGYVGKLAEKKKARKLRKQGKSYSEILKEVDAAKSTISRWCKDIVLTDEQIERLRNKSTVGARKGGLIAARSKRLNRIKRTKKLLRAGKAKVGGLTKRERFIAGIGLYLGDGNKGDSKVGFSNSNPNIISFMVNWFREFCEVSNSRYRGQVWIHENQNEKIAREFWSEVTDIPVSQFKKSYIVKNKKDSKKVRKNKHPYGVFSIRISSASTQRRILGWMAGVLKGFEVDNKGNLK